MTKIDFINILGEDQGPKDTFVKEKFMIRDYIEVLGEDEQTKALFVQAKDGSMTLDVIPAALGYLKLHAKYDLLHLQDYFGRIITMNQDSNIRTAVCDWENSRAEKAPEQIAVATAEAIQPSQI